LPGRFKADFSGSVKEKLYFDIVILQMFVDSFTSVWTATRGVSHQIAEATLNYVTAPRSGPCMTAWIGAGATAGAFAGTATAALTGGVSVVVVEPAAVMFGGLYGLARGMTIYMSSTGGGGGSGGGGGKSQEGLTADQIISQSTKARIRDVLPPEHLNKTLAESNKLAKSGDRTAQTARKLLTNKRFDK